MLQFTDPNDKAVIIEQVGSLVNQTDPALDGRFAAFIKMAIARAEVEIPYRAAALFCVSCGDIEDAEKLLAVGGITPSFIAPVNKGTNDTTR